MGARRIAIVWIAWTGLAGCTPGGPAPCTEDQEPRCDGDQVVTCAQGFEARAACGPAEECRQGRCIQTSVVLPDDAGPHEQLSEWWYYTGHLASDGREWGFQLTIFQYMRTTFTVYMCHVAIIDHEAGVHYHADDMDAAAGIWSSEPIDLEVLHCRFRLGGDGRDHVVGRIEDGREADGHPGAWRLELDVVPQKPVVLHGGDGSIPMSNAGGESWYYSYTRLTVAGTLGTPEGELPVTGQAWMDHQWGDFDVGEFQGWDWWSVQLEDRREVMLFQFRDWQGRLASQVGTIVGPEGDATELQGLDAFDVSALRSWQSTHTDGTYPLDWDVSIPAAGLDLQLRTGIDDQEMHNPVQNYWEGPVAIEGTRQGEAISGVGFVELTGYATDQLDP
jgi:predicted secreted hydrolase